MAVILVIDDDQEVRETLESLALRQEHQCLSAADLAQARKLLELHAFDLVFLDIRLPDGNGLSLLPVVNHLPDPPEVIIITGKGDPDGAELAIREGAWDYLLKPSSVKEITLLLKRALKYRAEKQARSAAVALDAGGMIGKAKVMRRVFDKLAMAASSQANVLITGETGTGKELLARVIHANSDQAGGSFVVVDCASLTENLVESTLFGHRKGAFTGAQSDQPGLIRAADNGALFLDEIGEMPMSMQKSFLRVLQERSFRPVGETREIRSNFRLISATNKDLEAMAEQGRFREDLLFRLNTIHIHLPPLRERVSDIKELAIAHVGRLCERYKRAMKGFDPGFFELLGAYAWPGNIRELFNVLEQALIAANQEPTLYAKHLPQHLRIAVKKHLIQQSAAAPELAAREQAPAPLPTATPLANEELPPLKDFKQNAEREYLRRLIALHGNDLLRLLEVSGLSRSHFYSLLKKYDLNLQS